MKKINYLIIVMFSLVTLGCYNDNDYLPSNLQPDEIIKQLSATTNSIPADGQSFTYIIVEIPLNAIDSKSTVTLTTTKGTFENNSKSITQLATVINENNSNKRIAKVKLISSTHIETADVTATIANVSKSIVINFNNLLYDNFLSVSTTNASIPADGASYTYIDVEQPLEIADSFTNITFTTSTGTFENGTKSISKPSTISLINGTYKRTARVKLIASINVETANVNVGITGTSKNIDVDFVKAFPESLSLQVSNPFIQNGINNSITITSTLTRLIGTPTANHVVTLTVKDNNLVSHGLFYNYNTTSNTSGKTINTFTLGNEGYSGPLTVTASSTNASGQPITSSIQILAL